MKKLTDLERSTLARATRTNLEIAVQDGVTEGAVKGRFSNIYDKLNLDHISSAKGCKRTAAVYTAAVAGILEPEDFEEVGH